MGRKAHATSNLEVCYKLIIRAFIMQFKQCQSEAFYCHLQLSVSTNTSLFIVPATQMMRVNC